MREACHIVASTAGLRENGLDTAPQAHRRIGRRASDLGDQHVAGGAIDRNDIGEGAAGVDPDPQPGLICRQCHRLMRLCAGKCASHGPNRRQQEGGSPTWSRIMGIQPGASQNAFGDASIGISDIGRIAA
jgi:hypothetical protein